MTHDPRPYRPSVGAVLRRPDGLLLMAERIDHDGIWQFPQGGIDPGESPEQALWRELGEELGFASPEALCTIVGSAPPTRYEYPPTTRSSLTERYRGQEQVMFLVDYSGTDADFRLDAHTEPEFKSIRWCTLATARELVWIYKAGLLETLVDALPGEFGG